MHPELVFSMIILGAQLNLVKRKVDWLYSDALINSISLSSLLLKSIAVATV